MATETTQTLASPRATSTTLAAACFSLAATLLFLGLFAALHLIEPEFTPSWRLVSEYATGRYGWVMMLAFLCMAFACAALVIALRPQIATHGGKVGLGLLVAATAALALAAFSPIDPVTTPPGTGTVHGMLHGLASLIGIPALPMAAMLISSSLSRNPAWAAAKWGLRAAAHATWISLALMIVLLVVQLPHAGHFGPTVWVGWTNRLVMLAYSAWLLVAAGYTLQMSR